MKQWSALGTEQLHCEVKKQDDGTITAISPELQVTILPDGEAKAFNRVFQKHKMLDKPLHAKLNNLAARIQQDKTTPKDAWKELKEWVDDKNSNNRERWLVAELDGVRVYIQGSNIIMTKRDLYK